jgi:hypothetical protein
MNNDSAGMKRGLKQFAWLVLIWSMSVGALGVAAGLMRFLMRLGGLSS